MSAAIALGGIELSLILEPLIVFPGALVPKKFERLLAEDI
jgi:hypothetical protein